MCVNKKSDVPLEFSMLNNEYDRRRIFGAKQIDRKKKC
jgi:hypothetical protein